MACICKKYTKKFNTCARWHSYLSLQTHWDLVAECRAGVVEVPGCSIRVSTIPPTFSTSPLSSLKVQAWSLKPSLGGSDLLLHQSAQWYSTDVDLTLVKHRPRRKLPIWCRKLLMVLVMGVDIHGDWRYHQSSTREMLQ